MGLQRQEGREAALSAALDVLAWSGAASEPSLPGEIVMQTRAQPIAFSTSKCLPAAEGLLQQTRRLRSPALQAARTPGCWEQPSETWQG